MGNMNEAGKGILLCTKNGYLMLMMTLMPKVNTDLKDIMAHTSWKSTAFKIISRSFIVDKGKFLLVLIIRL